MRPPKPSPSTISLLPPNSPREHLPLLAEVILFKHGPFSEELRFLTDQDVHLDKRRLQWLLAYALLCPPDTSTLSSSKTICQKIQYLESCGAHLNDTRLSISLLKGKKDLSAFHPGQVLHQQNLWDPASDRSLQALCSVLETTFKVFGPEDERVRYLFYTKHARFPSLNILFYNILQDVDIPLSWALFLENRGATINDEKEIHDLLKIFFSSSPATHWYEHPNHLVDRIDFLISHRMCALIREHKDEEAWAFRLAAKSHPRYLAHSKLTGEIFSIGACNEPMRRSRMRGRPILQCIDRMTLYTLLGESYQRHLVRPLICEALDSVSVRLQTLPHNYTKWTLVQHGQAIAEVSSDHLNVHSEKVVKVGSVLITRRKEILDLSRRGFFYGSLYRLFNTFITTGVYDPSGLGEDEKLQDVLAARYFGMKGLLEVMKDLGSYPEESVIEQHESEYYMVESFG